MKIAVLSGKGGAGKTFVSVNLATTLNNTIYLDCDVEEPNGNLFFKTTAQKTHTVFQPIPQFDLTKCNSCRICVDFCQFNALAFIKGPVLFQDVCHSCGGCVKLCPQEAITEKQHPVGIVEKGQYKKTSVYTGKMNVGEASGVPIIKKMFNITKEEIKQKDNIVIDCPPGNACLAMETIQNSDCCILVVEPTIFSLHDIEMSLELVSKMNKPCGVVINKATEDFTFVKDFFSKHNVPILAEIPFSYELGELISEAKILVEEKNEYKQIFENVITQIEKIYLEKRGN